MKTAGAGLAHSNGIGNSPGGLRYYAERTPELPQTWFVIDQLRMRLRTRRLSIMRLRRHSEEHGRRTPTSRAAKSWLRIWPTV